MKYFDVVNNNDQIIGTASAADCHSDPNLIHRVVHFTLVDGVTNEILISRRSDNVKFDSGMWCFMGEHLLSGDDYSEAVFRGIRDELGYEAIEGIGEQHHTIFYQENQTEFARFFVAYYNGEPIHPDSAEISEVKWVTLQELQENKDRYSEMTKFWIENVGWEEL